MRRCYSASGEHLIEREHSSDVLNNRSSRPHMSHNRNYSCAIHNTDDARVHTNLNWQNKQSTEDSALIDIIIANCAQNF